MTIVNLPDEVHQRLKKMKRKPPIIKHIIALIDGAIARDKRRDEFNKSMNEKMAYLVFIDGKPIKLSDMIKDPEINKHGLNYQTVYYRFRTNPKLTIDQLFSKSE